MSAASSNKTRFRPWLVTASAVIAAVIAITMLPASRADSLDQYRDELRALGEQQRQVDADLSRIVGQNETAPNTQRGSQQEREALRIRSQGLNRLRDEITAHIKDLQSELHNVEYKQMIDLFTGTFDVYLDGADLSTGKPSIHGATLDRKLEFNGRTLIRLFTPSGWCVIDPNKIIAVRSCPTTRPADNAL